MRYLLRRIGLYAIAAWASLTLNFILPRTMPGDPATQIFIRLAGRMKPEELAVLKAAYGFTEGPLLDQYVTYLSHVLRGDFGVSISSFPARVSDVIVTSIGWTLLLGIVALTISYLVGTTLGVIVGWRRGGRLDSIMPPLLIFIGSFPYFWLAMLVLYALAFSLGWMPMAHSYDLNLSPEWSWPFIGSVIHHLILPAGTIVLVSVGGWVLGMRNTLVGVLAEDYITMAEAKGLPEGRIVFHYALRNALLPNITSFGMSLGFILSGALLTEIVFSYPGLGFQLIKAVTNLDYPLMQGLFLMITFGVLGANFIVDLLYSRLDPRVRAR
ncbi:MAG: ABC transporter permease [Anaerolineae bacterium]|nr:ABC transporter permease [Anaerolineae bacterium]